MPAVGDAAIKRFDVKKGRSGKIMRVDMELHCDSGDGSFAVALSNRQMNDIAGYYCYNVMTKPGATAPTDNSDLAIADSESRVIVSASGNGLNQVDATSTLWFYPDGPTAGSTNFYPVAWPDRPWTITVTGNSVNSAVIEITLEMAE